ncbi:hypothetical protein ON010_g15212 [Phytophthora cinnamomi]|nr:hypothetical protein ON010_g15212 [Phytophthora cinnamomi]
MPRRESNSEENCSNTTQGGKCTSPKQHPSRTRRRTLKAPPPVHAIFLMYRWKKRRRTKSVTSSILAVGKLQQNKEAGRQTRKLSSPGCSYQLYNSHALDEVDGAAQLGHEHLQPLLALGLVSGVQTHDEVVDERQTALHAPPLAGRQRIGAVELALHLAALGRRRAVRRLEVDHLGQRAADVEPEEAAAVGRLGVQDVQVEAAQLAAARDDQPRDAGRAEQEHARPERLVPRASWRRHSCPAYAVGEGGGSVSSGRSGFGSNSCG